MPEPEQTDELQGERWHSPLQANAGVGEAPHRARLSAQTDDRELVRVLANYGDHSQSQGPTVVQAQPPPMPPPDECEPAPHVGPMPNGLVAAIRDRIEWRVAPGTVGWMRGERTGQAVTGGWVRFADGRPADVDALPLIADCLTPPVFDVAAGGWVPTLELTVHVRARPAPGWLRCWFRTRFLLDGYLEEDGEVWDENDHLVAQSRQLARLEPPPG
jgi:acyl-CoA thioesterase